MVYVEVAMNWNFKKREDRGGRWEAYYSPQGPEMAELYRWCWHTFGKPGWKDNPGARWDSNGGWIYFYYEEDVTLFLLRWS